LGDLPARFECLLHFGDNRIVYSSNVITMMIISWMNLHQSIGPLKQVHLQAVELEVFASSCRRIEFSRLCVRGGWKYDGRRYNNHSDETGKYIIHRGWQVIIGIGGKVLVRPRAQLRAGIQW